MAFSNLFDFLRIQTSESTPTLEEISASARPDTLAHWAMISRYICTLGTARGRSSEFNFISSVVSQDLLEQAKTGVTTAYDILAGRRLPLTADTATHGLAGDFNCALKRLGKEWDFNFLIPTDIHLHYPITAIARTVLHITTDQTYGTKACLEHYQRATALILANNSHTQRAVYACQGSFRLMQGHFQSPDKLFPIKRP